MSSVGSCRQRLEPPRRRGLELGPVELFLQPMIGLVADRPFDPQAFERLALQLDRLQPQPVVIGRGLRVVSVFRDFAGRRILVADRARRA